VLWKDVKNLLITSVKSVRALHREKLSVSVVFSQKLRFELCSKSVTKVL